MKNQRNSKFQACEKGISPKRLSSFRNAGDDENDILCHYIWNQSLCEALYPGLQNLEVALRNGIHTVAEAHFGNAYWMLDQNIIRGIKQQDAVAKAENELQHAGKSLDPGRLVAATNFGFWTGLFERTYDGASQFWPSMLQLVFPHIPAKIRTREFLYNHLKDIRQLRNRVFHHEPIWKRSKLVEEHATIINTIGWINPAIKEMTQVIDRFPIVHSSDYVAGLRVRIAESLKP